MTNVVEFPGKNKDRKRTTVNYVAEPVDLVGNPPNSKFDFTCVNCNNISSIQFDNTIFKTLELFCAKCGTGWRVTNPMFATRSRARSG